MLGRSSFASLPSCGCYSFHKICNIALFVYDETMALQSVISIRFRFFTVFRLVRIGSGQSILLSLLLLQFIKLSYLADTNLIFSLHLLFFECLFRLDCLCDLCVSQHFSNGLYFIANRKRGNDFFHSDGIGWQLILRIRLQNFEMFMHYYSEFSELLSHGEVKLLRTTQTWLSDKHG